MTIESWTDENPFCQKCEMIEKRKKIFRETHPHVNAEYLLSRPLENAIYSTRGVCADCKNPSKYLIVEEGIDEDNNYFRAWYYCGVCEVG